MAREPLVTRREFEQQTKTLREEIERIGSIVEGPPHPGLEKQVNTFIDQFKASEATREKLQKDMHEANQAKLSEVQAAIASKTQRDGFRQVLIALGMLGITAGMFTLGVITLFKEQIVGAILGK